MVNLQIIGIGILLVIMGTLFSLLGNIGSIIGFLIAITIVGYMIRGGYFKSTTYQTNTNMFGEIIFMRANLRCSIKQFFSRKVKRQIVINLILP